MRLVLIAIIAALIAIPASVALLVYFINRGWATFENAAHLATALGVLIGTATLIAIAVQLRQQNQLARAANSQALVDTSSDFVLNVASNRELANLWLTKVPEWRGLGDIEQAQHRYLVTWWLTFYENVHYQREAGLLDDSVFAAWQQDMKGFVKRRRVDKVWNALRPNYDPGFAADLEKQIDAWRSDPASTTTEYVVLLTDAGATVTATVPDLPSWTATKPTRDEALEAAGECIRNARADGTLSAPRAIARTYAV